MKADLSSVYKDPESLNSHKREPGVAGDNMRCGSMADVVSNGPFLRLQEDICTNELGSLRPWQFDHQSPSQHQENVTQLGDSREC
jgi:hypothetical protein